MEGFLGLCTEIGSRSGQYSVCRFLSVDVISASDTVAVLSERGCALVLSREAGAAALIGEFALLVNPYDVSATADAMHAGLIMPAAERQRRNADIAGAAAGRAPGRWLAEQASALD